MPITADCAQPCRWKYRVIPDGMPETVLTAEEYAQGTYLFNANDLCMIEHIPALVRAGITSFKIEGRAKAAYYAAVTTNAYKSAVAGYLAAPDPDSYQPPALDQTGAGYHQPPSVRHRLLFRYIAAEYGVRRIRAGLRGGRPW